MVSNIHSPWSQTLVLEPISMPHDRPYDWPFRLNSEILVSCDLVEIHDRFSVTFEFVLVVGPLDERHLPCPDEPF